MWDRHHPTLFFGIWNQLYFFTETFLEFWDLTMIFSSINGSRTCIYYRLCKKLWQCNSDLLLSVTTTPQLLNMHTVRNSRSSVVRFLIAFTYELVIFSELKKEPKQCSPIQTNSKCTCWFFKIIYEIYFWEFFLIYNTFFTVYGSLECLILILFVATFCSNSFLNKMKWNES